MAIEAIRSGAAFTQTQQAAPKGNGEGFASALTDVAKQVSALESQANDMALKIASGDVAELHNAMIAMQKASTALELTVQVRNKVLEAYQEIMRMQI
ncbi:MAG: hypothetical protein KatS3mg024_2341 [Armatimonadota bacterium]|nr:MAG: hypothetical protein KatS3mg024_2341 [Armatimonadota bacterium]